MFVHLKGKSTLIQFACIEMRRVTPPEVGSGF